MVECFDVSPENDHASPNVKTASDVDLQVLHVCMLGLRLCGQCACVSRNYAAFVDPRSGTACSSSRVNQI